MIRYRHKRIISLLLIMTMAASIYGCNREKDNGADALDAVYFSSKVVTIDNSSDDYSIYRQGDNIVFISGKRTSSQGDTLPEYRRYTIDGNGEISSVTLLNADPSEGFCPLGDNGTVACLSANGYQILDEKGNVIRNGVIPSADYTRHDIGRTDNGFVIVCDGYAKLYDNKGDLKAGISFSNIGNISEADAFFRRDGKDYLSVTQDTKTVFYQLDFNSGTYSRECDNSDFGFSGDDAVYRYGGYYYDEFGDAIGKLDMDNHTRVPLAHISNLIYPPPAELTGLNIYTHFLDDNTIAKVYRYKNRTDIVLISADDSSNYADRIKLSIKGNFINEDNTLLMAAYKFNMSQDEYLLNVSPFGSSFEYSNAAEAQKAKVKLLSDFQSGNAPDMLYGDDFDYEQMGKTDLVIDMKPYLSSEITDSINENIRGLMMTDGKCYSVFAGYTLYGYIGRSSQYPDSDYSISSLPGLAEGQRRVHPQYAHDLADYMIRYPIMNPSMREGVLSHDNIKLIVSESVNNGVGPADNVEQQDSFESGKDSLTLRYINNDIRNYIYMNRDADEPLNFVGFPSAGGSVKAIHPSGRIAISTGSKYPEACARFAEILLSEEIQRLNYSTGSIPVNDTILREYLDYMTAPDTIPDNEDNYKNLSEMSRAYIDETGHLHTDDGSVSVDKDTAGAYMSLITDVNTVINIDWGLYSIICDEIDSYYTESKSIDEIASSLESRLNLYVKENYL